MKIGDDIDKVHDFLLKKMEEIDRKTFESYEAMERRVVKAKEIIKKLIADRKLGENERCAVIGHQMLFNCLTSKNFEK